MAETLDLNAPDELESGQSGAVQESRKRAVSHIATGGAAGLIGGVGLAVALSTMGSLSLISGLLGSAVAGLGMIQLGRAAIHLRRYGSDRGALALAATAGLGASLVGAMLSVLPAVLAPVPALASLNFVSMIGVFGFGVFILLLTIGALVRWLAESAD